MKKHLLLVVILSFIYSSGITQTLSQTRTASFLNNLNQFQEVFGDQNYPRANAESVAVDDDIYARTSKLSAVRDSSSSFRSRSVSSLALQGFGFNISNDAVIQNISLRIKRFKSGTPTIGDHTLSLMQRYQCQPPPCRYGIYWTYLDNYSGKIYPGTETEYTFSQTGSGNNGGLNHDQVYIWTPAIVNQETFGVRIDNYVPIGKGPVVIYYDLVEVTIEYSVSTAGASHLENDGELTLLKAPIVYPHPFKGTAKMQFIAGETGDAFVELYNILGTKIRTVYSGKVVQGQTYQLTIGDVQLVSGMYIYRIRNGKQKYTGRIIKVE